MQRPTILAKPLLLIPLAALLAILPLLVHGCSCGHDMVFHLQSWLDAAAQLRHGHYPRWTYTSAWNAGEPRFLFYPPLSWLIGALLTLILPPNAAVSAFIFLTLTTAGFTFYKLASHFTRPNAALIASALYLANPYMLFNAFERSAFAELLAAAWIPLLLLAVLRRRPTIPSIALPLALLWLTNAPAGVMASYTLALLATFRVLHSLSKREKGTLRLALTYITGTLLGLTLPAFYLIPAAYERRYIQIDMAVIPNMRIQDNFFFTHTADPGHNGVNHQISLLALTLLLITLAVVTALLIRRALTKRHQPPNPSQPPPPNPSPTIAITVLTAALTLMLLPISQPIWNRLPELAFLQFPWRLLTILSPVLTLTIALLLPTYESRLSPSAQDLGAPFTRWPHHRVSGIARLSTLLVPLTLALIAFNLYAQFCQPTDRPPAVAEQFATHHGFSPTDEYTPNNADSDILRTDNPGYWLIPSTNPNTQAPNTIPTPAELNPTIQTDDTPVPLDQRLSTPAPTHLTLALPQPETLVLNLRNYPNWRITRTSPGSPASQLSPSPKDFAQNSTQTRDDGLLTIPLPAGPSTLDIHWHTTPDQQLGLALSAIAVLLLFWLSFRSVAKEPASGVSPAPTR